MTWHSLARLSIQLEGSKLVPGHQTLSRLPHSGRSISFHLSLSMQGLEGFIIGNNVLRGRAVIGRKLRARAYRARSRERAFFTLLDILADSA